MADRKADRTRGKRKSGSRPGGRDRQGAKSRPDPAHALQTLDFRRKNWVLFGSGLASILLGFGLLGAGDITLAPILLVLGYLVRVPWALVARSRDHDREETAQAVGGRGADRGE